MRTLEGNFLVKLSFWRIIDLKGGSEIGPIGFP